MAIFLGILSNFLFAKTLTPGEFGSYSYFVSVILVAGSCLPFGFDTLVLRECSIFIPLKKWGSFNALLKLAYFVSIIIVVAAIPVVYYVFYQNHDRNIEKLPFWHFVIYILSFVFVGFAILRQHLIQAMEFVSESQFIFNVTRPLVIVIVLFIYWINAVTVNFENALFIFLLATVITFFMMEWFFFSKREMVNNNQFDESNTKKWLVTAMFLFLYDLVGNIGNNLDIFIAKQYLTESDTGIYVVCRKLSLLAAFGINITGIAIRTKFATLYQANKLLEVQKLITLSTRIVFLLFAPLGLGLIFFGKEVLIFIRFEYVFGYEALIILCIAELLNLFFGPSTIFLLMISHEKQANVISILNLIVQGILIYLLIPYYGVLGIAYAILACTIFKNLTIYLYIRLKTGIRFAAF